MTNITQESFIREMAEIIYLGFALSDAMKQATRGGARTARVTCDGQDWMLEITDAPQRAIMITLVE